MNRQQSRHRCKDTQQEPEVASYFEMHVRGCYIVEVYYHADEQDGSKNKIW